VTPAVGQNPAGESNDYAITEHPSEGDAYCPGKKEDSVWREMWRNTG
jgi:hypothetical protein